MKKSLIFYTGYIIYWLCTFLLLKIIFLIYNAGLTADLPLKEIPRIFYYGLSMDLSASFYLMIIPTLLMISLPLFSWKLFSKIISIYTIIIIIIISLMLAVDLELYHYWDFRLDKTPLKYLNNSPGIMLASVHLWEVIRQLMIGGVLAATTWYAYKKLLRKLIPSEGKTTWIAIPVFMFILALSIIPIRGGLGVATMNSGFAYFSDIPYANHAALNMPFHAFESLANNHPEVNPYNDIKPDIAESYCSNLKPEASHATTPVLKTNRPNIILIVLESFTSKVIEPLGGLPGVTPNISRLTHEGILFTNFYASGDRTDKALPAILSSFTAIPDQSVSKFSGRAEHLPMFPAEFKSLGYNTTFWYGGTIDFAGLQSYVINGKFNRIMTIKDFTPSDRTFKWGVHDEIVFDSLFADAGKSPEPFFKVMLSQSSHEPFDVPMDPVFKGTDKETKFLNSIYYTDSVLGDFIDRSRSQSWWDNTLVILIADHGARLPGKTPNESWDKFRIPMLWLGGALSVKDTLVTKISSQTDIFPTIMAQLSAPIPENILVGKDILSDSSPSIAYYAFNNGFGLITDSSRYVIDNVTDRIIFRSGTVSDSLLTMGKSIRQLTYKYFIEL